MKTPKYLEYIPIVALCICLFIYYPAGVPLLGIALFISIIFLKNNIAWVFEDVLIISYLIISTLVYMSLNNQLPNYFEIVVSPVVFYVTASAMKTDGVKALKMLLPFLLLYSALVFFRDVSGNFSLSITDNVFMHQRLADTPEATDPGASKFFKNATLVAIWPLTAFVVSMCLYNSSKKWLYLAVMFGSFIMIFLTNTRTALGVAIIVMSINLVLNKQWVILRLMLLAIPILIVVVLSLGNLYQSQIERFNNLTEGNSSYGLGNRTTYWHYTLNLIDKSIWGYGHDYVHSHIGFSTHNDYLGQAVSVGLLAAVCYYAFILFSLYKRYSYLKKYKNGPIWNEIAFYLLIVYLISALTEQISLGNRAWIALLFIALGWSKAQNKVKYNVVSVQLNSGTAA